MKVRSVDIADRDLTVAVDVCAGKFIQSQFTLSLCMKVCSVDIADRDLAVAVDVPLQVYFHILRHRFSAHRHGILPGDMIFLQHPHGIGTGSDPGNTVGGGILIPLLRSAGGRGFIRRL